MTRQLLHAIKEIFCLNTKDDTSREETIFPKKLCKGDGAWSIQKVVLGWAIDTVQKALTLPGDSMGKIISLIYAILTSASRCLRHRW